MFLKKQTFVIQTTDRQSNGAKLSLDAKHLKRDWLGGGETFGALLFRKYCFWPI